MPSTLVRIQNPIRQTGSRWLLAVAFLFSGWAQAQQAALACFEPASIALYEERRQAFRDRRDAFIPLLADIGLPTPVLPDGAFYAWADCSAA